MTLGAAGFHVQNIVLGTKLIVLHSVLYNLANQSMVFEGYRLESLVCLLPRGLLKQGIYAGIIV